MASPVFQLFALIDDLPEGEEYMIKNDAGEVVEAPFSAIISTDDQDGQGDVVDQDGLETEYFTKSGKLNYEHLKGAAGVIGYPISTERVTLEGGRKATRMHGRIYLHKTLGRETYETMRAMHKSAGDRRMGCSVEGPVLKRQGKRIVKSRVTNVALTSDPANFHARVDMVKSLTAKGYKEKEEAGEFEEPEEEELDEAVGAKEDPAPETPEPGVEEPPVVEEPPAPPQTPQASVAEVAILLMQKMQDQDLRPEQALELARALIAIVNGQNAVDAPIGV